MASTFRQQPDFVSSLRKRSSGAFPGPFTLEKALPLPFGPDTVRNLPFESFQRLAPSEQDVDLLG